MSARCPSRSLIASDLDRDERLAQADAVARRERQLLDDRPRAAR